MTCSMPYSGADFSRASLLRDALFGHGAMAFSEWDPRLHFMSEDRVCNPHVIRTGTYSAGKVATLSAFNFFPDYGQTLEGWREEGVGGGGLSPGRPQVMANIY